jgi:O-antigen ligase
MKEIATFIFAVGILGLFWLDRDRRGKVSYALSIPLLWLLTEESRAVSGWFETETASASPDQYLDGSPVDRVFYLILLSAGIVVLLTRYKRLSEILRRNLPILLFFGYCALSIFWSDYPEVSFKRWTKAIADLVMILVVLTEVNQLAAIKRLLAWTAFILVPLSILFIKYYPDLGRGYLPWVWTPVNVGVTTNKNTLGMVTMILGFGSLWRFLQEFTLNKGKRRRWTKPMFAHAAILVMVAWLLWAANSATSLSCFVMGSALMIATSIFRFARGPKAIHMMVALMLIGSFTALFLDLGSGLVETLGRDPTLTGRTEIWKLVLPMVPNQFLGAGFESFWLGKRLEKIWSIYWWHPNEAHNGYFEVYLNLGAVGIACLGLLIVTGYRRVVAAVQRNSSNSIWLVYLVTALTYNFTEAGFRILHPVWFFFLFSAIVAGEVLRTRKTVAVKVPAVLPPEVPCLLQA